MPNDRDESLKRTQERAYENARRGGFDHGKAKKIANEATEKADAQKKKLGHW